MSLAEYPQDVKLQQTGNIFQIFVQNYLFKNILRLNFQEKNSFLEKPHYQCSL